MNKEIGEWLARNKRKCELILNMGHSIEFIYGSYARVTINSKLEASIFIPKADMEDAFMAPPNKWCKIHPLEIPRIDMIRYLEGGGVNIIGRRGQATRYDYYLGPKGFKTNIVL